SWLHNLFLGHKNAPTEIPISSYHVNGDKLFISVYNEEGLTFPLQEKQFDISTSFPAASSPAEAIGNHISKRTFWLGTDKYGRDFLSRMLIGIRVSLSIGFVAVLISLLIGITLGAVAGYFGGKTDNIIMWLINVTWSIPTLLLVIALTLVLGKGVWQVFIAVGLTMWVGVARVVRGQVMTIKEKQYVTAARALGFN